MAKHKTMCENDKQLYSLFKTAIESERKAQSLFKQAIQYCAKPIMKEILQGLYEEEVKHEKALIDLYNEIRKEYDIEGEPY